MSCPTENPDIEKRANIGGQTLVDNAVSLLVNCRVYDVPS